MGLYDVALDRKRPRCVKEPIRVRKGNCVDHCWEGTWVQRGVEYLNWAGEMRLVRPRASSSRRIPKGSRGQGAFSKSSSQKESSKGVGVGKKNRKHGRKSEGGKDGHVGKKLSVCSKNWVVGKEDKDRATEVQEKKRVLRGSVVGESQQSEKSKGGKSLKTINGEKKDASWTDSSGSSGPSLVSPRGKGDRRVWDSGGLGGPRFVPNR